MSPAATPTSSEQPAELHQLDLFVDGRDALLVHAVVMNLLARDFGGAAARRSTLRHEHPAHPDLPALALLIESLRSSPPSPVTHASVTAALDHVDRTLAPAARRLLGRDAAPFLEPLWHMLAATVLPLSFDETYPRAHASWLCQQFGDWSAVRAAVEAELDWAKQPLLGYRLGLARHHLGDVDGAIRLWLPLCWIDPPFFARYAPALPNATLREGWEAFERVGSFGEWADGIHPATWFPPWLLVKLRGLRGTVFDPFGRAEVRRVERELIGEYRSLVDKALVGLSPESHARAVKLANLPDVIRGYENIKLKNVQKFRDEVRALGF